MSESSKKLMFTIIAIVWVYTILRSILIILFGKKIFKKAHKGEKTAFYPVINLFTMLIIADISDYFGILLFIPGINIIVLTAMSWKLGKVFNTSFAFRLGLVLCPLLFYPLLAYGDYQYKLADEDFFKEMNNTRSDSVNLMTEEEIKEINETPEVEEPQKEVDSIFKSDTAIMEKTAPYKAAKIDILDMEKLKDAPMEDDVFKPIERQEEPTEKESKLEELSKEEPKLKKVINPELDFVELSDENKENEDKLNMFVE